MTEKELTKRIKDWHSGAGKDLELHEYLGMTWEQYQQWLCGPSNDKRD